MTYYDLNTNLTWEDSAVRESTNQFAREVMRPIATVLDRMTAAEVVAEESPLYEFFRQAHSFEMHKAAFPEELGGAGLTPLQIAIAQEEMGWGSVGLSVHLGASSFPFLFLAMSGNQPLIEKYVIPYVNCSDGSMRGCWGISEPNHGADMVGFGEAFFHQPGVNMDLRARLEGDEWVISGQKAAWVSGAPAATHCLLHVQVDNSLGMAGSGVAFLPLDLEGVSKGGALEKIGQRDLCQGEIFFDNVRVPYDHMLLGPEQYETAVFAILASANCFMSLWATGLSRAAFEEALSWCKDRIQGGKPLVEHFSIKERLHRMFSRVESSRALSRTVAEHNINNPAPAPEYSMSAKALCTEQCYANADESVQLHGGCGLTREYPVEKLYRDARAMLIEDGTTEVIYAKAGRVMVTTYPRVQNLAEAGA